MEKYLNKKVVITKEDDEDFENSIKCWICDNAYVDDDDVKEEMSSTRSDV